MTFGFVERRPRLCGAQLPAASSARKVSVWGPSASPEKRAGLVQPPKDPESSMHITLATSKAGVPMKANVASVLLIVPGGPVSMTVSGGVET